DPLPRSRHDLVRTARPRWRVRTSRPAGASRQAAGSRDELLLDAPRCFGTCRSLVGVCYLRVDLADVVPVVADHRGDPADVDREYLRGGGDRGGSALIDLADELDHLPDI